MDTCYHCGEEIVFRWVDGGLRPIHVNGGWCPGSSSSGLAIARSNFVGFKSYLDPNARCPVCGASVFFYRSPHNGRVFFDDVGWPWPKHPCTDKYQGRDSEIRRPARSRFRFHFRSREGRSLQVFAAEWIVERNDEVLMRLRNVEDSRQQDLAVNLSEMRLQDVSISDLRGAPSLILPKDLELEGAIEVSFMCARLQRIVVLAACARKAQT